MEELLALMFAGMLLLAAVIPLLMILIPLKLWADVRVLRQRLDSLEDDLDQLQHPRVAPDQARQEGSTSVQKDQAEEVIPPPPPPFEPFLQTPQETAASRPDSPNVPTPDGSPSTEDAPALEKAAWSAPSPERIAMLLGASIGGIAVLMGLVFGMVAVMEAGFFGPAARVAGGLILGTALWITGAATRGRLFAVPSALAGAGMGSLYGALFAAHSYYGLLGPTPTFLLLVLVSVVAGLRATVHNDRFMAYMGLFGGLMAPLVVSTGQNGAVGLFLFLLLLTTGTLLSASRRRWPDLIAATLLGTGLIYAGWTAKWLAPDSVFIALVASFGLAIPYAVTASRVAGDRPTDQLTRFIGGLGSVVWMGLATPWVLPLDSAFTDPRTKITVLQTSGAIREISAFAIALLPLPAWLAARTRHTATGSVVVTLFALTLSLAWTGGWAATLDAPDALTVLGPIGPLFIGLLLHLKARRTGVGLGLLLAGWASASMSASLMGLSPLLLAVSLMASTLLAIGGSFVASTSPLQLALLFSAGLSLTAQASAPEPEPLWIAGSILMLLGVLPFASLSTRWPHDRIPAAGWLTSVLSGWVLFPAAFLTWDYHLGKGIIGLLPVLFGFHSLLVAAVLVQVHRLKLEHPVVLISIVSILAGVTFALPLQLQEKWLTVGWAMESAALAWMAIRIRHPFIRWASALLGLAIGIRLLINPWALSYGTAAGLPILNWTLYTWGIPTLCLIAAAMGLERSQPEREDGLSPAPAALRLLAMGTGFALVNVQVSHAFQHTGPIELGGNTMLQGMVRSIAWGGWGLFLLLLGLGFKSRVTRFVGFAFMLLAAAKVFIYDLWAMPGMVRVGSLLGLGFTLLISAVLFNWLVLREPSESGES